jgi:sirohydrochlorin cobaltochelatase
MENNKNSAIIVASFGTSYAETRAKTIEACEHRLSAAFPAYRIQRAFTSYGVIKKLRARDGLAIPTPQEAAESLAREGYTQLYVQPLHIIPGEEFHEKILAKLLPLRNRFETLAIGRPILFLESDYTLAVEAIKQQMPLCGRGEALLLMGHGSKHPANACYSCLQSFINDEKLPVYIGNVEGYPELDIILTRVREADIHRVHLMPFMLVAGDHARNDMAGAGEDSWKSVLEREGFSVTVHLEGLGENEIIQQMYVDHLRDAVDGVPGASVQLV